MIDLTSFGWSEFFQKQTVQRPAAIPARVIAQERDRYVVITESGERSATVAGRLRHSWQRREDVPVVGDWVLVVRNPEETTVTLVQRLERRTAMQRKMTGEVTESQVVAANIDVVMIVCSMNRELNVRRIERYLTAVWDTGARPLVVLNKKDVCEGPEEVMNALESITLTCAVVAVSARTGEGMEALRSEVKRGETAVLVGSSGVGKSSLTNRLLGFEQQAVSDIREGDDKGRHTTTRRDLLGLPEGGAIIDTPGMREFQLWEGDVSMFADVEALSSQCRFRDCGHQSEPGCAILEAVERGELAEDRWHSYQKLAKELARVEAKKDLTAQLKEKQRIKELHRLYRRTMQAKKDQRRGRFR